MRRAVGPAGARWAAGARRRGRQSGGARGIESGDLLATADGTGSTAWTPSTTRSTRSGEGSLELTVVRGTEERAVTVEFESREAAA